MKRFFLLGITSFALFSSNLHSHCQMPCGIYHDNMVYDLIDQYVETMYKGISVLNASKFHGVHDWNEVIRWVMLKEKESDKVADLITTYFLQQKIKPGEPDTAKRLTSAHKLLFLLVGIKQQTEVKFVKDFLLEWEEFKSLFHVEGYQCQIEMLKQKKRENEQQKKEAPSSEKIESEKEPKKDTAK